MKTIIRLLSIVFLFLNFQVMGQECLSGGCANFVNQYPSSTFSTSSASWTTVNSYMNGGNYTLFNVTSGNTYEWSYCEDYGGISTSWDAQLTLFNYSSGNQLCYSDDYCGTNGNAPYISWTATFSGVVMLLTSEYSCSSNGPSGPYNKLVWRMAGSGLVCTNWSVSPSSQSVPSSGGSYSATVNASGSCSFNLTIQDSWIVFDNYGSGGIFNFHVLANTGSSRTGLVRINDVTDGISNVATLTINQSGVTQTGSVHVSILPSSAVSAGATWNIDGSGSYAAGYTLSNVSIGNHTIGFNSVSGWTTPSSQSISVSSGNTTNVTGTYTLNQTNGAVQVNIYPAAANNDGAQWQLDGVGSWYSSGYTIASVATGNHYVNFKSISGWTSPASQNISVLNGQTSVVSGTYVENTNTLIELITPNGAEQFTVGDNHTIYGIVSSNVTNIQLEYSTDNGLTFFPISSVAPSSEMFVYNWTIPATPSNLCKVRATGTYQGGTITDLSNSVFTITLSCFSYTPDCDYCYSTYPYLDAPSSPCVMSGNIGCLADAWSFCQYNCTSWTAWCINKAMGYTSLTGYHPFTNNSVFSQSTHLGDAANWESALSALGYVCDNIPANGSIAWYAAGTPGTTNGHVAFTNCVSGNIVTLTEFNFQPSCYYNVRTVDISQPSAPGNRVPTKFIHLEVGGLGSGPSAITELSQDGYSIYPNPVTDELVIERKYFSSSNNTSYSIFSIEGKMMLSNKFSDLAVKVDLRDVPAGIYILKVEDEAGVCVKKFIKQ
jgi:hypothetical protein